MKVVFKSVKGKRSKNEDAWGEEDDTLFLVADGLGGHAAGEVASKIAIEKAKQVFTLVRAEAPENILKRIFEEVNSEILARAESQEDLKGMGTTMVAALLDEDRIYLGSVGDSSAFIYSSGELSRLIRQDRNAFGMLSQALGTGKNIEVNLSGAKVKRKDIILLATDGLTDFLHIKIIKSLLGEDLTLHEKADSLIENSLKVDSTDNITVCLIEL